MNSFIYLLLFLFSLISTNALAQETVEDKSCSGNTSNEWNDSEEALELILTSDEFEKYRVEANLTELKGSTIELLPANNYSCSWLNSFVSEHSKGMPNSHNTYYKVSNHYFIVQWYTVNTTRYRTIMVFDNEYKPVSAFLL